jgi:hypothetical protein
MVRKTTYLLLGDRVDLDLARTITGGEELRVRRESEGVDGGFVLEEGCRRARGRKVGGGRGEVGEEMDLLGLSKE